MNKELNKPFFVKFWRYLNTEFGDFCFDFIVFEDSDSFIILFHSIIHHHAKRILWLERSFVVTIASAPGLSSSSSLFREFLGRHLSQLIPSWRVTTIPWLQSLITWWFVAHFSKVYNIRLDQIMII